MTANAIPTDATKISVAGKVAVFDVASGVAVGLEVGATVGKGVGDSPDNTTLKWAVSTASCQPLVASAIEVPNTKVPFLL
jgi:hypothetical protein